MLPLLKMQSPQRKCLSAVPLVDLTDLKWNIPVIWNRQISPTFAKIRGMDSYLSPEMKSTGEAIGYDDKLTRALYKALQATGMNVSNYGTIFVTIADHDKEQALPLVRRFYDLGFNIEATTGTAEFLRNHGIRTRTRRKLSEGSSEIIDSLRQGH